MYNGVKHRLLVRLQALCVDVSAVEFLTAVKAGSYMLIFLQVCTVKVVAFIEASLLLYISCPLCMN